MRVMDLCDLPLIFHDRFVPTMPMTLTAAARTGHQEHALTSYALNIIS